MEQSIEDFLSGLKFGADGLIPVVVQDFDSGEVLMVAYMNRESLKMTFNTGKTCFYSRSRNELWVKGETSGHFQFVKEVRLDCDADTLLVKVEQVGVACHEGYRSCFFREVKALAGDEMEISCCIEKESELT